MSRASTLTWCCLAAGVLCRDASAQSAADYRRRLDSLERRSAVTDRLKSERRARLLESAPRDTIRRGSLRVVVLRELGTRAEPLVDSAWAVIDSTYGGGATALDPLTFGLLYPDHPRHTVFEPGELVVNPTALVGMAAHQIGLHADTGLSSWLQGTFIPGSADQVRWDLLYIELATTAWHHIRECYADHLASCRLALGLDGREDPVTRWYDADDRRRFVGSSAQELRGTDLALRKQCLEQQADAACVAAFRALSAGVVFPPLGGGARMSLLQLAVSKGGRGAYDRLMASRTRPIAERLGLAAGVPGDSLVAEWRGRVIAARSRSVALTPRGAWVTVGWCLLFGLLAIRSSRWR